MLTIRTNEEGEIAFSGRLDASQTDAAAEVLNKVEKSTILNFRELKYISSAGLGVLLAVQKRLSQKGEKLKIREMDNHIRDIFRYARFDMIFDIEEKR